MSVIAERTDRHYGKRGVLKNGDGEVEDRLKE